MRKPSQKQILQDRAVAHVRRYFPWLNTLSNEAAVSAYMSGYQHGAKAREEHIRIKEKISVRGVKVCSTCGFGRNTYTHREICGT